MALSDRLKELGIQLPAVAGPFGAYLPAKKSGSLLYVAGQLPMRDGKLIATGPVSSRMTALAQEASRQCVINALAAAGTTVAIDEVVGVVRVGAFVASEADFTQQPVVANAASELLVQLFGEPGRHVRAAVGVTILPLNASVELEFIFSLRA